VDRNPDPLGFAVQLRYCIGIHIGEQPWQDFEDRHLGARSRVDMAEFERDDTATNKHDARGQTALAQHIVGGDHQLGARERQPARLRARGDYDVLGFQDLTVDRHRIRAGEAAAASDHFDAAPPHRLRKRAGNASDHCLFPVDQ